MKKVLLFADIGGHDKQEYYHVGDEAMWYETYRWYREHHHDWRLTTLSWFKTHQKLQVEELEHRHWSKALTLISVIREQDRIHFTGGGNISSLFRPWLYYCLFVIVAAKLFGKEVVLTSQTIGPFWGIDRLFAASALNMPHLIAIRALTSKREMFAKYGIVLPQIKSMLDAAYTLPAKKIKNHATNPKNLTIGLSLHAWSDYETATIKVVQKLLTGLAKTNKLKVILIPHHIASKKGVGDSTFMERVIAKLPSNNKVINPPYKKIMAETIPAQYIKELTGSLDLLLTTRYHGIIFGLSQNVPTIAIGLDEYCRVKNEGALKMFFGQDIDRYQVTANESNAIKNLQVKVAWILQNHSKIKKNMQQLNAQLHTRIDNLDTISSQLDNDR